MEIGTRTGSVQIGEPRRLAVLAALAVDTDRVVPTTTLVDRVWGDEPPGQAVKTLSTYITRIRRVLHESFRDSPVTVVNQPGGYRLTARPDQVDLFRFRDLVDEAREQACPREKRAIVLRQAVALHRGDPLTGASGAWATRTREHLNGELLAAQAEWAEAELAVGNAATVLAPLAILTGTNPLVEPLILALVRALVAAGRPTEALERCRLHQQRLVTEYGTDPSPQLTALYASILRSDDLDGQIGPPPAEASRPVPDQDGPGLTRPPAQLPLSARGFAGRDAELAALEGISRSGDANPAAPAVIAISGIAGIGKPNPGI
ncbi:AfsR/SARP family transcriptional regulator [Actinoplanes derwentensis]|uniref:AfsR/SARP family transcriptional regulator n=1 Tax=Actinoplanes derwentensis TaxID=113562 RepID=UPI0012FDCFDD|nr:BTAD domain-containing putative transcriptional regulator [Actinoplanes derwentensis]